MQNAVVKALKKVYLPIILLILLSVAFLLPSCAEEGNLPRESSQPDHTEITTESTASTQTATEAFSLDGLQSVPLFQSGRDSDRAHMTSGGNVWETDAGFYFLWDSILHYADKRDLSIWLPVCSRPNCTHSLSGGLCSAAMLSEVVLKDERIYFNTDARHTAALSDCGLRSEFVASMALDGTDIRLEYYIPEIEENMGSGANGFRSILTGSYFVYNLSVMNEDGIYETYVYLADEAGATLLASGTQEANLVTALSAHQMGLYGDLGFCTTMIAEDAESSMNYVYRMVDGELISTNLEGLYQYGSNLSSDSLWYFRAGDGYYDIDLATREETKLAEAQLENSHAAIMMRNCILESTLLGTESLELREGVEAHAFRFFDGEVWQEVTLPEELLHAMDTVYLQPQAVTSDRILLLCRDSEKMYYDPVQLYQIRLTDDILTLEYLATID